MPLSPRKTGFTLIELLVVIAIIGVLAAIALPAYKNVAKAAATECLANVRQIALATIAYAGDNNYMLPTAGTGSAAEWPKLISPYSGSEAKDRRSIFVCPGCEFPVKSATGTEIAITRGMHGGLMPKAGAPKSLRAVTRPTQVILCAEIPSKIPHPLPSGRAAADPPIWSRPSLSDPKTTTGTTRGSATDTTAKPMW